MLIFVIIFNFVPIVNKRFPRRTIKNEKGVKKLMKKIGKIFFAVIVMLIALNVVNKAEAAETEPLISVKLSNYLGNKSSITIQPSEIYRIKGTNLILSAKKDYEVKVTSSGIAIYKGTEKLAEFPSFEVTPSTYDATLSIQGRKYLGDVAFTNESQKYVRPINTLPIEDYLKGVVPEESLKNWTSLNTFKAQSAPKAPSISAVTTTSTAISGTAVPGSLVYVKAGSSSAAILARGNTNASGVYNVTIPTQSAGTKIYVVIKADGFYSPYAWTLVK